MPPNNHALPPNTRFLRQKHGPRGLETSYCISNVGAIVEQIINSVSLTPAQRREINNFRIAAHFSRGDSPEKRKERSQFIDELLKHQNLRYREILEQMKVDHAVFEAFVRAFPEEF